MRSAFARLLARVARTPVLVDLAYIAVGCLAAPLAVLRYWRTGKPVACWREKLTGAVPPLPSSPSRPIWIHAVSVGEVLQARPLVDALRRRERGCPIVLSASTATGLEIARQRFADCHVIPNPFDLSWAVARTIRRIQPWAIVLIELELWPNLLTIAARAGVPVSIVSGRLSERSARGYARLRPLFSAMLTQLSYVDVQTQEYAERFLALGLPADRVSVSGCLKHDSLPLTMDPAAVESLRRSFCVAEHELVLVAGSTHDPEEAAVLQTYRELRDEGVALRLVLVPRHPERFSVVAEAITSGGDLVARRSRDESLRGEPVGLLDTLGELAACWHLADIAFVGGSLTPRGGQNMFEPAAAGAAVLFGPNVWNFPREVRELLEAGGAVQVHSATELKSALRLLIQDADKRRQLAIAAKAAVSQCRGASDVAAARLLPACVLPESNHQRDAA